MYAWIRAWTSSRLVYVRETQIYSYPLNTRMLTSPTASQNSPILPMITKSFQGTPRVLASPTSMSRLQMVNSEDRQNQLSQTTVCKAATEPPRHLLLPNRTRSRVERGLRQADQESRAMRLHHLPHTTKRLAEITKFKLDR